MFENSVHFLPTFRTPYTTFENNSVPVPFTHLRVQKFSVLHTSFFEINPYTSRTCTSFSFFTRTPYCFRFRTLVRMTEYVRIRTRTPGSGRNTHPTDTREGGWGGFLQLTHTHARSYTLYGP